jgi:hypothetical protein
MVIENVCVCVCVCVCVSYRQKVKHSVMMTCTYNYVDLLLQRYIVNRTLPQTLLCFLDVHSFSHIELISSSSALWFTDVEISLGR